MKLRNCQPEISQMHVGKNSFQDDRKDQFRRIKNRSYFTYLFCFQKEDPFRKLNYWSIFTYLYSFRNEDPF